MKAAYLRSPEKNEAGVHEKKATPQLREAVHAISKNEARLSAIDQRMCHRLDFGGSWARCQKDVLRKRGGRRSVIWTYGVAEQMSVRAAELHG